VETINTAPSKAAAGRLSGKSLICRPLMRMYVIAKITLATSSLLPVIHSAAIVDGASLFNGIAAFYFESWTLSVGR
jgi:hypothetical protein